MKRFFFIYEKIFITMIFDGIILILCLLAFIRGWRKGLLWAIVSVIAVFVAVLVSLKLSNLLATYLFETHIIQSQYTLILSFVCLFLATIFLFRTIVKFAEKILETLFLGWINKLFGGILYCFFILFVISTFIWLTSKVNLLKPANKLQSKTYHYIERISPKTIAFISPYIPYFKGLYSDIESYFAKQKEKTLK